MVCIVMGRVDCLGALLSVMFQVMVLADVEEGCCVLALSGAGHARLTARDST